MDLRHEPEPTDAVTIALPAGWLASDACPPEVRHVLSASTPAEDRATALVLGSRLLDAWHTASTDARRLRGVVDLGAERRRSAALAEDLRAAEAAAEAHQKVREALQSEFAGAVARARQDAHEQAQSVVAACQTLVDAARGDERRRAELESERTRQELRECREQLQAAWGQRLRGAGAAARGRDNEALFRDLLVRAYGNVPGFAVVDTAHLPESGDHIVSVGGPATIMFENKKYAHPVPRAEVDKAHRDFRLHPECAALVFVSEDSRITGHDRSHDLDMALVDRRPVFYLSHFGVCEDPVALLNMLLSVVRLFGQPTPGAPGADDLETEAKIQAVRGLFVRSFERVRALRTLWNSAKRKLDTVWREFAAEIEAAIAHFECSLNGGADADDPDGAAPPHKKKKNK